MIGKRIGKLIVLSLDREEVKVQGNGRKQYLKFFNCQCDCGNKTVVRQSQLSSKATKSCGCQRVESNKARFIDISGQKFHSLTVVERDNLSGKWKCLCECGSETLVMASRLKNGNTKSCGCRQKNHARSMMLEKHKDWRRELGLDENSRLSSENQLQRAEFSKLVPSVFARDEYYCAWCSSQRGNIQVHHIEMWSISAEKRFDMNNLVTLCQSCHKQVHGNNFNTLPDPIMTILLQGYVNETEEAYAARIPVTPN